MPPSIDSRSKAYFCPHSHRILIGIVVGGSCDCFIPVRVFMLPFLICASQHDHWIQPPGSAGTNAAREGQHRHGSNAGILPQLAEGETTILSDEGQVFSQPSLAVN